MIVTFELLYFTACFLQQREIELSFVCMRHTVTVSVLFAGEVRGFKHPPLVEGDPHCGN